MDEKKEEQAFLKLEGPLTVYEVTEMRDMLIASMNGSRQMILDLQGVTECDTAGIQLLLSARKKAVRDQKFLRITDCSDSVKQAAERIGINSASIMG